MKVLAIALALMTGVSCSQQERTSLADSSVMTDSSHISPPTTTLDTFAQYNIILDTNYIPGDVDTTLTKQLPEPIRAVAAFYAAMGGTLCDGEYCQLTTALGLGKQGSEEHKDLIKRYFPDDKLASAVLEQNCYLRPSGASSFSDYGFLSITVLKDTVTVDYDLTHYNRGDFSRTTGPDIYSFDGSTFRKRSRNIWPTLDQ